MYMRGKLLFVGYVFSGSSRSVRDLQKQISRSRGDYRLGLSLPSDYRFRYHCTTAVELIYCCSSLSLLTPEFIKESRTPELRPSPVLQKLIWECFPLCLCFHPRQWCSEFWCNAEVRRWHNTGSSSGGKKDQVTILTFIDSWLICFVIYLVCPS